MAAIRKRGDNWQVQIRRQGMSPLSKTFSRKSDALTWARSTEVKAQENELPPDRRILNSLTLSDLVERYLSEIVTTKKGVEVETIVLKRFLRESLCQRKLATIFQSDFASYRDRRLTEVTAKTVARQLAPISNMFRIARLEWGIPVHNPLAGLKLDSNGNRRERRLRDGEQERLLKAATTSRNPYLLPVVLLALETAMRRGEILSMLWDHVDLNRRSVTIPEAKNGHSRTIPLSIEAKRILSELKREGAEIFPISPLALRLAWVRLAKRAKVDDLHFHDLRHEAISRFFEKGLTVPEVASISGHKDVRMLLRYAHADNSRVISKLDNI
ncbi:site-specific integrase [Mesorhizobium sp. VNQ89]|uniref:site-specific integrase n=1 Tax=Mesorhizobium quangtriensis TaxID=3157709 RepID=UPI0032B80CD0